jgi:CubicO group peptidase (beta-lactamase class C family)/pimeloyl-ACP methyl ester carboxylesterase
VSVPLDYARPDGRRIDIHISRALARDPAKRRGTLIVHEGGPAPHLADASTFGRLAPAELTDAYDVVTFDQRGFGASARIHCGLRLDQQYTMPWPMPGGPPAERDRARDIARQCATHAGAELPYLGTANVARDIDAIRAALGERTVSYLGISYGTYLGAVYDRLFPERVDRMLLDSNVNPATAWQGMFRTALTAGTEQRFGDFARFAVAHQGEYGLGGDEAAVRASVLDLVARRDREPLRTPAGDVAGTHLRIAVFAGLYNDAAFPQTAALLAAARDGDVAAAAQAGTAMQIWFDDDNTASAQLAVFCADGDYGYSPRQQRADATQYPLTGGAGSVIWPCSFWPTKHDGPPVAVTDHGKRNILLTNNTRDPATVHIGAVDLRHGYGDRARLVSIDHGGHGGYLLAGNACADRIGTDFLVTGARPAADVACPAEHAGLVGALTHLTTVDGVPAAIAAVSDAGGAATFTSGGPVRADDRVRIFSNTKAFVATVLLQLVAEHGVDLDAPVERYLPGLVGDNKITVRRLLQHTSGLPDFDSAVFEPGGYQAHRFDHHEPRDLVADALRAPRLAPPGAEFHYSTTNYVLAGMIVERVTGRPYGAEVRDRIIKPLELTGTSVPGDDPTLPHPHATGYAHVDEQDAISDHGRLVDVSVLNPSLVWAGGEMVSTVTDLNTFFGALVGGRLLPPAQLAEMRTTVPSDELIPGSRYGLGLLEVPLTCGGSYWSHGGSGLGYQTRQGVTTDGRQVSIAMTVAPATAAQAADQLAAVDTALCEARKS